MFKSEATATRPKNGRLADHLVRRMLATIKGMAAGTKLPTENQLAHDFGVSRTVVREAISQLNAIGVLKSQQGAGNFVAVPSHTLSFRELDHHNPVDIMKFLEIRSGLDAAAARLAATRRTKSQLAAMREACQRTIEPTSLIDAAESDIAFHLAIVEATANEHFVSVHRFLSAQLKEGIIFTRRLIAGSAEMESGVRNEHRGILEAIEQGDASAAAKRAEEHMLHSQERLRSTVSALARNLDRR